MPVKVAGQKVIGLHTHDPDLAGGADGLTGLLQHLRGEVSVGIAQFAVAVLKMGA